MKKTIYKLITGENKYAAKQIKNKEILKESTQKMVETLKNAGIKKVNLVSLGNSIATGYSMNDEIIPLFNRNETLEETFNKNGINLSVYHFARAQNNNDEHILEWVIHNFTLEQINKMVRADFIDGFCKMNTDYSEPNKLETYYSKKNEFSQKGIRDIIQDTSSTNIIVYNGLTGSFLDNVTRNGQSFALSGFNRDFISLQAVLKHIYLFNPKTQVYICGIPNLLGINIVEVYNQKLKKICKMYPNTTYVNSANARLIYGNNGKIIPDLHYAKHEYLQLNHNIVNAINHNFIKNQLLIEFDMLMKEYSQTKELSNTKLSYNDEVITEIIDYLKTKYEPQLTKSDFSELLSYYKKRYPYDYYYTPRSTIIKKRKKTSD